VTGTWVSTSRGEHLRRRPSRHTTPELLLRRALHAAGARFRLHRPLAPACTPDLVLPRHRIAVFVDGDFWHGCPEHGRKRPFTGPNADLWTTKIQRTKQRDRAANETATKLGWIVVRVWECEVRADPNATALRVLSAGKH
jgi:DNA mismatch endonuclease (patch repair protein)